MMRILLLFFTGSMLGLWGPHALGAEGGLELSGQLAYIVDAKGQETLGSIRALPEESWISAGGQTVNLGFSPNVHWFRLKLPACAAAEQKRILEVAYPLLDDVRIWEVAAHEVVRSYQLGDTVPFKSRPIDHLSFAVPVGCAEHTLMFFRVHSTSAMQLPIVLWDRDVFHREATLLLMPQFFYYGAMLVMVLYNLFVFISVRNLAYLYYVVFTLSFVAFQAGLTGMGFRYVWSDFPAINNYMVDKPLNWVTFCALAFAMEYMRTRLHYPKLFRYGRLFLLAVVAYHLISFALPYRVAIKITIVLIMMAITLGFVVNVKAILNRQREGYFYIVAWSMFLNAALVLALNKLGLIPRNPVTENSVQWASVLESLLLSFALADQLNILRKNLASSHQELQATLDSIETIVSEKTEDIRSILTTVQQGIMTVRGHDLRIEAEHSPYTLKALQTQSLTGLSLKKAFLDKLDLGEDQRHSVQSALQVCLEDGLIAFELNSSQFPSEVRLKAEDGLRDLVVDWTPILQAHGAIDRFLIVFRDVTDWKKLESIQASQNEMLGKLQQMTKADPQLLRKFLAQSEKLLDVHLSISMHVDPANILKNIFIDIHTLKGEARSLGLLDLAEACHRLEDGMARMRSGQEAMSQITLQTLLLETQEVLHSYQRIYQERLKGIMGDRDVLVKLDQLDSWREQIVKLAEKYGAERRELQGLLQDIHSILYMNFDQLQSKLHRWCRRIALDLGRPEPRLEIHSEVVYLDGRATDNLDKIFIHILQNALAHGIEAPEVRRMHGKSPQGLIEIRLVRQDHQVRMSIRDDGRGFDTARIRRKAALLGLVTDEKKMTRERLKELVLTSGFSSLESAHSYAGRGVGLDAVQGLVKQLGGRLSIELYNEAIPGFIPFQFVIELPSDLFPNTEGIAKEDPAPRTA